jgi:hypothetical protein
MLLFILGFYFIFHKVKCLEVIEISGSFVDILDDPKQIFEKKRQVNGNQLMYANLVQQQPIHLYHFLPGKNKNLVANYNNKNRSLESATKLKKIPI